MRHQVLPNGYQLMAIEDLVFRRILSRRRRSARKYQVQGVFHQWRRFTGPVRAVERPSCRQHVFLVSRWMRPIAGHARVGTGRAVGEINISDRTLIRESRLVVLLASAGIQDKSPWSESGGFDHRAGSVIGVGAKRMLRVF